MLINGSSGIGTGWSTDIPPFNPKDILKNIKLHFAGIEMEEMYPYYRNFKGSIYKRGNNFYSKGIYSAKNDVITIKELPIGVWSDKYKEYLEGLIIDSKAKSSKQIIRYYNSYCSDVDVHFEITMDQNLIDHLNTYDEKIGMTKLEKALKIVSSINTSNMVAFDRNNKIKKYSNVNEILKEYIETRIEFYNLRKQNMMETMNEDIKYLSMKIRFIKEFISGELSINNQTKQMIIDQLKSREFLMKDDSYDYLLKMPIYNLTKEKIDEFDDINHKKNNELEILKTKTEKDLWTTDFEEIESILEPKKKIKFTKK